MLTDSPPPLLGEEPTYSRSVFEAILAGTGWPEPVTLPCQCSDDGARVTKVGLVGPMSWHPWCEAMSPGSPNPRDEPWLRFPFTARQLAAFMVYGWGYLVRAMYGDWESGPDEARLRRLADLDGKAVEALRGAYQAYRHAERLAPCLDARFEDAASTLAEQYIEARNQAMAQERLRELGRQDAEYGARLGRVNDAVAELDQRSNEARAAADLACSSWRRAVVQHLLLPVEDVSDDCFGSQILRDLPANMRAAALHLEQAQASFQDVDEAQAHFSLMKQISGIERELLNWEQLKPRDITEAGRRKDEIKALKEQRDDLRVRVKAGSGNDRGRKSGIGFREEATAHRQQRRLAELRALGGDWVQRSGSWRAKDQQSGAFGRLVEQEKSNGSRNSSEKTVRRDLCAAAEAEADSKRSGTIFGGLGTP